MCATAVRGVVEFQVNCQENVMSTVLWADLLLNNGEVASDGVVRGEGR